MASSTTAPQVLDAFIFTIPLSRGVHKTILTLERSPEAAKCCLFSNFSLSSLVLNKGSQLLGFLAFQLLAVGPVIPALDQPGSNPLTWLVAEIFPCLKALRRSGTGQFLHPV